MSLPFKTGSASQEHSLPPETAGEDNLASPAKEPDTVERRKAVGDSLWPRAIIGAGLLVTVAWVALLGWSAVKLVW